MLNGRQVSREHGEKKCGLIRSHFYYGAKIENVSKMLGYTNITQTQRYAKVLARSVQDEFDRMVDIINKNNTP